MQLIPSIDLREGRVVRLLRGDDGGRTVYDRDPAELLAEWAAAGVGLVHLVDLDAALGGAPQAEQLARLLALARRPRLQLGGGLRSAGAVEEALRRGCERAVVGSLVASDPAAFASLARRWPGRLVPALDVADGEVRVDGWRSGGGDWRSLAERLRGLPCPAVLVTDVARDGALGGPNLDLACAVGEATGLPALLSGGVAGLEDLRAAARRPGIAGAIVGRALHEGRFGLAEALAAAGDAGAAAGTGLMARVIPCLDVAHGRVVKGVRFQDLADAGDIAEAAARYAAEGADELVFLDVSASHEGRDTQLEWVERVAAQVFVPLTVGGGVRSVEDARRLLLAGADKVGVNTAPVTRPDLLDELAHRFGSQCVVLSVDARRRPAGGWEVVTHGGRTATGRDALDWIGEGVGRGAGEILLTSVDGDGTQGGYDLELTAAAARRVPVPVIASGGAGEPAHLAAALAAGAAAVLAASIFHGRRYTVGDVKRHLAAAGFAIREAA